MSISILKAIIKSGVSFAKSKYGKEAVEKAIKNANKKFQVSLKISKPKTDVSKKESRLDMYTVSARNLKEAKELAKEKVKKSFRFKDDADNLAFEGNFRKPRVDIHSVNLKKGKTMRTVFESPRAAKSRKLFGEKKISKIKDSRVFATSRFKKK